MSKLPEAVEDIDIQCLKCTLHTELSNQKDLSSEKQNILGCKCKVQFKILLHTTALWALSFLLDWAQSFSFKHFIVKCM